MTPLHTQNRLKLRNENTAVLASSPAKRSMFFLLFVLLACAMIFGLEPARDFSGARLIGTIVYFLLLLTVLGVAGYERRIVFDRSARRVTPERSLFSFTVSREEEIVLDDHAKIVMQTVELVKGSTERENRSGYLAGFLTARTHLYRLFVVGGEEKLRIEESTYPEEIENLGETLSDFLVVSFDHETM